MQISEISQRLEISEMTIYRDIKPLIICRDFLTDMTINAKMACFLLHADINLLVANLRLFLLNPFIRQSNFKMGLVE
ncbi:hypothetical protein [Brevibacillus laterosporus]|uniref:hypothetical protein n=1 Tax=Brevibacillus laterosporus TaxID=1465 RepID=UPI003D1FE213